MTEETKKNQNTLLWVILALALARLGIGVSLLEPPSAVELNEMVEQMTIEKEELQEEYEDLAIQFDGYQQMDIRNDSLQDLLEP